MANVTNLKHGSTGDEVKQLQQALGFTGKDVDGIFGNKTQQAVIDFQKANGLTVDGIAGKNTLGKLYSNNGAQAAGSNAGNAGNNAGAAPADAAPATAEPSTFTHPSYADVKSDTVKQAETILQQYEATRPGEWVDPYRDKYMGYLEQYENRDPFSYDFNSDALYQQYKDQYIQQGQMAMMDTMGQAAAMTGGYGNSYAQTVGQQAYNQQLGQLNAIMPELYQMAYERYGQEGQEMLDMFNMYMGLSEQDRSRHQTDVDNWYKEIGRLTDNVNTEYQRDYNDYLLGYNTDWDEYITDKNQKFTANEADKERQWKTEEADKDRGAKAKDTDSKTTNTSNWDNGKLTESQVKMLQEVLGVTVDGKWGDESFKAAGNMTADEALKAYQRGELKKDAKPGDNKPATMSDAAKKFMSNLPYAHAGSSAETWKSVVKERMMAQYDSGALTDEDVMEIINQLGL